MTIHVRKNITIFAAVFLVVIATFVASVHQRVAAQDNPVTDDSDCPEGSFLPDDGSNECVQLEFDADFDFAGTMKPFGPNVRPSTAVSRSAASARAAAPSYPQGQYKVQVIWATPSNVEVPANLEENFILEMNNVQNYLRKEIGRALRLEPGLPIVKMGNASTAGPISEAVVKAGYKDPKTFYVVLADVKSPPGSGYCGLGGGQYAVLFVGSCGQYPLDVAGRIKGVTSVMLHELFHSLGAVPTCAPNSDGGGHMKSGQYDLMQNFVTTDPFIDKGRDDYFGHGRSDCWDVAKVDVFVPTSQCRTGPWCTSTRPPRPNPAPTPVTKGRTTMSSAYPGTDPARAFDKNTNGRWSSGSVASTKREIQPWWQVDLGKSESIGDVVVWNRTDCCKDRLKDFFVFVSDQPFKSDSLTDLINDKNVTQLRVKDVPNPKATVNFRGMRGRYVRVQLNGADFLSLAEVEVKTTGPAKMTASQSSNYDRNTYASKAIDGNTNGNWNAQSLTHTKKEKNPWWQVELDGSYALDKIVVWNRTECSCADRLFDFYVFTSEKPFRSNDVATLLADRNVQHIRVKKQPNPSYTYYYRKNERAKYVRIQLANENYLTLAEVEIMVK